MTIIEAISKTDALKPNGYAQADKVSWLNTLDGSIKNDVIDTHDYNKDETEVTFNGYTDDTNVETSLIVPDPFADVYVSYLMAQIDYANGEIAKYNNSMAMFNSQYAAYVGDYHRKHMPKGEKVKFI